MITRFKQAIWCVVTLWALLAFVAWHYENDCGVFFSAKCGSVYWEGVRWIALLKWVFPYQTLLGGIAALAAGAFVLLAARQTSSDARSDRLAAQRQASLVACSILSGEMRDAWYLLGTYGLAQLLPARPVQSPFTQFSTYIPALHAINPFIAALTSSVKRDAETEASSTREYSRYKEHQIVAARCIAMSRILEFVGNNLREDATFRFEATGPKVPGKGVGALIRRVGVTPGQLLGMDVFFDWDK